MTALVVTDLVETPATEGGNGAMRLGRLYVRLAPSMWCDLRPHLARGWLYPRILTAVRDERTTWGRGFVVGVFGVMLWVTWDFGEVRL